MSDAKGKDFEHLVFCINKLLHLKYIVTPNDRIENKDTGRLRQIDISVRTRDGPTQFLGIIEARCRRRPVTTEYVEQASEKARSVRANATYIVSSCGFAKTALQKAQHLGIGTLSYKETLEADWDGVLRRLETSYCTRRYDRVFLFNMDNAFSEIINPHPSVRKAVEEDIDALVLVYRKHNPIYSIARLAHNIITYACEELYDGIHPSR